MSESDVPYKLTTLPTLDRVDWITCTGDRCGRKIMRGTLAEGSDIEIKCPRCKTVFRVFVPFRQSGG